jgi:glucose-1-phosphate thymidylyltransferase
VKLIVLGAGYATRLYPLTLNQPKPLLPVAGKPMLEHVLDNLKSLTNLDHIYIVTNAKFAGHFQLWADAYATKHEGAPITIINDQTTDESNRLGAIGDVDLVLTQAAIDDDVVVVAGDNLFSQKLEQFGEFLQRVQRPVLACTMSAILKRSKSTTR